MFYSFVSSSTHATIEEDILIIENWWRNIRGCPQRKTKIFYTIEEIEHKIKRCQESFEYWMNYVRNVRKRDREENKENKDRVKIFLRMVQTVLFKKNTKNINNFRLENAWKNILEY